MKKLCDDLKIPIDSRYDDQYYGTATRNHHIRKQEDVQERFSYLKQILVDDSRPTPIEFKSKVTPFDPQDGPTKSKIPDAIPFSTADSISTLKSIRHSDVADQVLTSMKNKLVINEEEEQEKEEHEIDDYDHDSYTNDTEDDIEEDFDFDW